MDSLKNPPRASGVRAPRFNLKKVLAFGVIPVAMLGAAAIIWQASFSAFSGSTRNSGNAWSTGTVSLTDDDAGSARFNATGIVPGQTETKCLTVTSHSNVPGIVKVYYLNPVVSPQGLEDHIIFTGDIGTGGSFGSCTGFVSDGGPTAPGVSLATLVAASFDYASGSSPWTTTGTPGESKSYKITWTFDATGLTQSQLDQLQGAQTGADVQWEIQSI